MRSAVAVWLGWAHGRTQKRILPDSVVVGDRMREERLARHGQGVG
jgi:hypothetical protein